MKYSLLLTAPLFLIYKLWISNMDAKQTFRMASLRFVNTIQPKLAHSANIAADSIVIDSLSDKIYHLKRVQKLNAVSRISILLPESLDEPCDFRVGYNLEERFQTILFFTYKKQDKKLYFYDIEEDNLIDVADWDQ